MLLKARKSTILRYQGLTARDAGGRTLPAHMEASNHRIRLIVDDRQAQYPLTVDPTWSQQAELTATDGASNNAFGYSVALSGTTAVIGAPGKNADQGAAYVFTQSGTNWTQQAELTASDGASGDRFGISVAVSGSTAVIGAYNHKVGNNVYQGAAYVFVDNSGSWSQQAELTASDGAVDDYFGISVALSGSTAVIGAEGKNSSQGAAYVFVQSGASWSQQAELTATDGAVGDYFGYSVALSGSTAVIGAYGKNSSQGAAYVFTQSGSSWTQQAELTASDGASGDEFGWSVALSGSTAAIGADAKNSYQGAAYVFTQSGTGWSQQAELTASDGASGDLFGHSVAVSGSTAVIGAYSHKVGNNANQGAAYVFTQSGATWSQQAELTSADGAVGDRFGFSVALSGSTAVVGAEYQTVGSNTKQGAAYVFQGPPSLSVAAGHASPIFQSGPGVLTLTVANSGPATLGTATVTDVIPSAFTVNSADPGCSISSQTVTCTIAPGLTASIGFNVYVTATATASTAGIANTATLTDNSASDAIVTASSTDTIAVSAQTPQEDIELKQIAISGSTDFGSCHAGYRTMTVTDLLQNISGSILINPYAINIALTGGNTLLSDSASATSVAPGAEVTNTFHVQLASCSGYKLTFDEESGYQPVYFTAWGDSLTAGCEDGTGPGCAYPYQLSQLIANSTVLNEGIGGQTSTQIAVRMGAVPTYVTNAFTIPASGSVSEVTFETGHEPCFNDGTPGQNEGTIDGVQIYCQYTSDGTYTLTRVTAGTAQNVSIGDAWTPVLGPNELNGMNLIWAGRNDSAACPPTNVTTSNCQVASNIAAMTAYVTANGGKYLVLTVINGELDGDPPTSYAYSEISAIDAWIASTYPNNSLDIREKLVAAYDPANPIDVLDHSNDIPPYSLRAFDNGGNLASAVNSTTTCAIGFGRTLGGSVIVSIGSEYIFINSGNDGAYSCIRGYAGTTASTYSSGTLWVAADPLHLSGAGTGNTVNPLGPGYTFVAKTVQAALANLP